MNLAPIVLFVYNRPNHTLKTLQALKQNKHANESTLYIFADGLKDNASICEKNEVNKTRGNLKKEKWCKNVNIVERDSNLGLANSIIDGVSKIIKKFGKVIVLEDDIVTGNYFLEFINKGLQIYQDDKQVFGISGYTFPHNNTIKEETFFLPIMSSWGYATWLDRWEKINFNGEELLSAVKSKKIKQNLNFNGINYYKMLQDQVAGNNDSWAVRFYVSMYLNKGLFLYPSKTLLNNIGFDGTGVHCNTDLHNKHIQSFIEDKQVKITKKTIKLRKKNLKAYESKNSRPLNRRMKKIIKKIVDPDLIRRIKFKLNMDDNKNTILDIPRYSETTVKLQGEEIIIPDSASFYFMNKEIFEEEIYKFTTNTSKPYIIDGGANIGLASIYFKKLYPDSEIIAFEPDKKIYDILSSNISKFNLPNVKLVNKGLWNEDTVLSFRSEGADAGLISDKTDTDINAQFESIQVESLRPYLDKKVDFLKLDIEGAETEVLVDIKDLLINVNHIFVEYHSFIDKKQSLGKIINILENANFRLYISSPGLKNKSPFIKVKTYNNMDMQLNIYGVKKS